jgi:PAS domain-containing protein
VVRANRRNALTQSSTTIPHAAFAIDTGHKITHWNKGMEKLTGVPAAQRIGTEQAVVAFL